jgi:hypothetical protein
MIAIESKEYQTLLNDSSITKTKARAPKEND